MRSKHISRKLHFICSILKSDRMCRMKECAQYASNPIKHISYTLTRISAQRWAVATLRMAKLPLQVKQPRTLWSAVSGSILPESLNTCHRQINPLPPLVRGLGLSRIRQTVLVSVCSAGGLCSSSPFTPLPQVLACSHLDTQSLTPPTSCSVNYGSLQRLRHHNLSHTSLEM